MTSFQVPIQMATTEVISVPVEAMTAGPTLAVATAATRVSYWISWPLQRSKSSFVSLGDDWDELERKAAKGNCLIISPHTRSHLSSNSRPEAGRRKESGWIRRVR